MTSTPVSVASPPRNLFRAMQTAANGRPLVGTGDAMLGARVPIDIRPEADGSVRPGKGGMSVTPDDPGRLPPHFRPAKLGGFGALPVFWVADAALGPDLAVRYDAKKPDKHALVEPAREMALADYQMHLASTEPSWREWS